MIRDPQLAGGGQPTEARMNIPIPRVGDAEEVAKMMLFIAADATYSTGSEFVIDGGLTAGSAQGASQL